MSAAGEQATWNTTVVEDVRAWHAMRDEWEGLVEGRPFCRFDWMEQWWRSYGMDRGRLQIVTVRDMQNRLRGFAPWWRQVTVSQGALLQMLGSGNVCSDYLTLPCRSEDGPAVAEAVARWLCESRDWDTLELEGVLADDPVVLHMVEYCRGRGCGIVQRPAMSCWRIEFPSTWDEYLARLSKSHRKQVRRVEKRMLDSGSCRLRRAESLEEMRRIFADLVRLHQARWQSVGEPGAFACPRMVSFLEGMMAKWHADGRVCLYELVEEGTTLAAEIHFVESGVSYAYQSGVDPRHRERNIGHAMNVAVLRSLMEEGMRALDFLRGDEPYKAHFRAEPRPAAWWRIAAPQWRGRVRHHAYVAQRTLRGWVKDVLALAGRTDG